MADSKKYDGNTWEHSLRKLGTSTDTLTTLPAVVYADGTNATVGLVGNMSQTGTPTPQNPIQPQETGERTENLVEDYIADCNIWTDGTLTSDTSFKMFVAKVVQGQEYSLDAPSVCGFFTSKPSIGSTSYNNTRDTSGVYSFVAPIDGYIAFRKASTETTAMLNTGSTIKPYEPYGYKIPISSASTTTPVYLGEVETTRRIKKLVLTGEENLKILSNGFAYTDTITDYSKVNGNISICTHFRTNSSVISADNVINGVSFYNAPTENYRLYIKDSKLFTTITTLKSWLAEQYAAGTPVTVWYVLATEEAGIVNEPLRKIGDYADTVSGITIPTITGADSFDVLTTLKPSEVSLTYTGWHDASVKEWDGSEWQ